MPTKEAFLSSPLEERVSELKKRVSPEDAKTIEELEWLADHDELTGILNLRGFKKKVAHIFEEPLHGTPPVPSETHPRRELDPNRACLLYFDMDHFKKVNDELGHPAGDAAIKGMVAYWKMHVRPDDIFARQGGDEFLILFRGSSAEEIFQKFRNEEGVSSVRFPVPVDNETVWVTLSGGIVDIAAGDSLDDAIKMADVALYSAKREGRNRIVTYTPEGLKGNATSIS